VKTVSLPMDDWDFVLGSLMLQETNVAEADRVRTEIKKQLLKGVVE
jgi:hypothetical protein